MYSTVVISPADPQAGGYYLDFFFYRIAYVQGYANQSGDGLTVNQGYGDRWVEGTERPVRVEGDVERAGSGIRFTITFSEDPYLTEGEVYTYERGTDGTYGITGTLYGYSFECPDSAAATYRMFTFFEDGTWSAEYANYRGDVDIAPDTGTWYVSSGDSDAAELRLFYDTGDAFGVVTVYDNFGSYELTVDGVDAVYYRFQMP